VLHLSCNIGNAKIVNFILKKAGPSHLGVLDKMINSSDELGLAPIYLLCQRGFRVKMKQASCGVAELDEDYKEHLDRCKILNELISGVESGLP